MSRTAGLGSLVGPIGLVIVLVAGLAYLSYRSRETDGERAERLAAAPSVACETMWRDVRRRHGDEQYRDVDEHYTQGDLRYERDLLEYAKDELDGATDPDALVILRYLEYDERSSDALAQTGDMAVVEERVPAGHRRLVEAAQTCAELGYPEWRDYLYEETGSEDYSPR